MGDDDEVLVFVGRQLVGAALGGFKVVFDLCADDAARLGGFGGSVGAGGVDGGLAIARIVVLVLAVGVAAVALGAAEDLEIAYRNEATGVRQRRVAGLIPVGIVFATDDVEEVALGEAEDLNAGLGKALNEGIVGLVVVVGSDDLCIKRSALPRICRSPCTCTSRPCVGDGTMRAKARLGAMHRSGRDQPFWAGRLRAPTWSRWRGCWACVSRPSWNDVEP